MNPKDIKKLIKMLRAEGVTHYKTADLELNLSPIEMGGRLTARLQPVKLKDAGSNPACPAIPSKTPLDAPYEEEKPIEHNDVNLVSLLKLSDEDLLDRLIPDHTKEAEESAIDTN